MSRSSFFPIFLVAHLFVSSAIGIGLSAWLCLGTPLDKQPQNTVPAIVWVSWSVLAIATYLGIKMARSLHRYLQQLDKQIQTLTAQSSQPLSEPPTESNFPNSPDRDRLITLEQALNTAPDFPTALQITLDQISQLTGWSYGEAWIPTGDKSALQCSPLWSKNTQTLSRDRLIALQDFRHYTEGLILLPGEDIPGQVWQNNQPQWLGDLTQDNDIFSRGPLAQEVGLKAAFGLPLPADETLASNLIPRRSETLGILVFFTHQPSLSDRHWVKLLSQHASDFGRILRQKQVTTEFKTLFTAMTDLILVFDDQGYILNIAPTNPKPLYKMSSELIGKNLQDIFEVEQATIFIDWIWETLNTNTTLQTEYQLTINNQVVWFSATIAPIIDASGIVDSVILIARDITERQEAMEALSQAKEAAEAANQAKSTFLAKMSHELRTPLNSILGFTQVMLRHLESPPLTPNPDQIEEHCGYLHVIHNSGEHLLDLINDLLNWSKIEAGKMLLYPSRFNLYDILDTLYQMFQLKARYKGLTLSFNIDSAVPPFIEADSGKLRQILINLLGNALKFTSQGEVTVRVYWIQKESSQYGELTCEVEDTGIGISPTELDRLFEPFVQSSGDRGYQEGTGLGLPISQQMVELMGGTLMVESQLNQGTQFRFTLPVKPAEIAPTLNASEPIKPKIPSYLRGVNSDPVLQNSSVGQQEDLSYLQSADWLRLQQATLEADEELLLKLIPEIFHPTSAIAQSLIRWVSDFQFDRLYEWINDHMTHKGTQQ